MTRVTTQVPGICQSNSPVPSLCHRVEYSTRPTHVSSFSCVNCSDLKTVVKHVYGMRGRSVWKDGEEEEGLWDRDLVGRNLVFEFQCALYFVLE